VLAAPEALAAAGLTPVQLEAKEGLALINGTQVSTALALDGLFRIARNFRAAVIAGAMAVEAVKGSHRPFDARISALRGQPGQIAVAGLFRALLTGSALNASHQGPQCDRVQDPYSLRCQPQVMGAVLDNLRHAARTLRIEANGVTDNPLVLVDTGEVLSGGNFHAEPVAIVCDLMAIAASEIGALSERRIALLIDASLSGLPPFLAEQPGLNSGFMIQEDHVSMAPNAARRLVAIADNVANIVGIELLAAAQGLDFQRPLASSAPVEAAFALIRARVPRLHEDRLLAPDITAASALVCEGAFDDLVPVAME